MFDKHLGTCSEFCTELAAVQSAVEADPAIPIPPFHLPDLINVLESYSKWVSANKMSLLTATKKAQTSGHAEVARFLAG